MVSLKPFFRARKFMLHVDVTACDNASDNDFTEVSTNDDIKHLDSLLVSSKSASQYDSI